MFKFGLKKMINWRLAVPWTTQEDAQRCLDGFHQQGIKVIGYGTITCFDDEGNEFYLVVYDLYGPRKQYELSKRLLTSFKEIFWNGQKLVLPKGIKEN